jgi:hypothetical protein
MKELYNLALFGYLNLGGIVDLCRHFGGESKKCWRILAGRHVKQPRDEGYK